MQKMSKGRIEFYKEHYPRGTRVQLDSMGDDPNPVEPGAVGTVISVDDMGTLHTAPSPQAFSSMVRSTSSATVWCLTLFCSNRKPRNLKRAA